jgi:uncharacterized protein YegP (UPF0339 family)
MPYNIVKTSNGKYKLVLRANNKVLGIHDSILKAKKQIMAIEANKKKK